ncbi:MAG TPA: FAD-dependent thymidylate synthase [Bacteroidota bacterium]|nr:FAD-dependent thymidylate synthase [Bacteroidota bacterium]
MTQQFEALDRPTVPELDAILGQPFHVLDDGFIRVVDYMGTDASIVQAARVSYGKGTKQLRQDAGLIRYLMRHHHTTPFEMCELKLHVRVPMDTWRQWIRHRSANVNEYSTRYSIAIDAAQRTSAEQWRLQAVSNRQGSEGFADAELGERLSAGELDLQEHARRVYNERINLGIAREQARKDLPLATYTEAYWKIDLHNLLHFLHLRMDAHAQFEIREYARIIGYEIVSRWCPLAWQAFLDYRVNALEMTRIDSDIIAALATGDSERAIALAREYELLPPEGEAVKRNMEREELESKLRRLGMRIPWPVADAAE